jgi:hypothetical protein
MLFRGAIISEADRQIRCWERRGSMGKASSRPLFGMWRRDTVRLLPDAEYPDV